MEYEVYLDQFRRFFHWLFVSIGLTVMAILAVWTAWLGYQGQMLTYISGIVIALGILASLKWGPYWLSYLLFSAGHFGLAVLYLAPGLMPNSAGALGNQFLAWCQLILFQGLNGVLAPSRRAWWLFTAVTLILGIGDLLWLLAAELLPAQIAAVLFFLVMTIVGSMGLFLIFHRAAVQVDGALRKSSVLEADQQLKELQFRRLGHDMRSPLTAAFTALEALEASELTEEQYSYLQLFRQAQTMLMEDLETYLQGHLPEKWSDDLEAVNPVEFCASLTQLYQPAARRKDLELVLQAPPAIQVQPVQLPRHLLRHVLNNLLNNAVRYTVRGRVVLEYQASETQHLFAVSDTGPGLPPEGSAPAADQGFGLGLGIVRTLMPLMKGQLTVQSTAEGTRFEIRLPRV